MSVFVWYMVQFLVAYTSTLRLLSKSHHFLPKLGSFSWWWQRRGKPWRCRRRDGWCIAENTAISVAFTLRKKKQWKVKNSFNDLVLKHSTSRQLCPSLAFVPGAKKRGEGQAHTRGKGSPPTCLFIFVFIIFDATKVI